jgi:hypothetical protein
MKDFIDHITDALHTAVHYGMCAAELLAGVPVLSVEDRHARKVMVDAAFDASADSTSFAATDSFKFDDGRRLDSDAFARDRSSAEKMGDAICGVPNEYSTLFRHT